MTGPGWPRPAGKRFRQAALGVLAIAAVAIMPAAAAEAPAEAATLDLRASCGAKADGVADDSLALKTCLTRLQAAMNAGHPSVLRIPAGIYRITGANGVMPTLSGHGGALIGDGPHASYFVLDPSYDGDLFSWSEAWAANHFGPHSYVAAQDANGPTVTGIQITGSTDAPHVQNAFVFYDRNDDVLLRDVQIDYLNGQCISVGRKKTVPVAYMRESAFYNVKCFIAGTKDLPAVELSSASQKGSDATNEIDFYKLHIFDTPGTALAIRNPNPFSATRRLRFFGLRLENIGGDGLVFGDPADDGQVQEIDIYALTVVGARGAAVRFTGSAKAPLPYQISIHGDSIGGGNSTGIAIERGRLLDFDLAFVDAPIVLGPLAGSDISFRGNGEQRAWKFEGTVPSGKVAHPLDVHTDFKLYGLPTGGDKVGAAVLQAAATGDAPVRLTMDGKPPNAYNCFNPSYVQAFNLSIQLMARDTTTPDRWFAWTLPLGVLTAPTGPGSTTWTEGTPATLAGANATGARVQAAADTRNGCLSLSFAPPPHNTVRWEVSAHVAFARAP